MVSPPMSASAASPVALVLLVLGSGPAGDPSPPVPVNGRPIAVAESFAVMGTEATFTIWTTDAQRAKKAFADAHAEIDRIERLMTDWERPEWTPSDVVR